MKRIIVTMLIAVLFCLNAATAATWQIDRAHSSINFAATHMVISKIHGTFNEFDGTIMWDGQDVSNGSVEFTVQSASINTDNEKRDGHLRSDDFFNAETYPTLTFKSKKVVKGEGGNFKLVGDMTIRDVTKEVTFDCKLNGVIDDGRGGKRAGFSAATTINRKDFNVNWSKTLDSGGLVVGDDIAVNLEIETVMKAEG